MMAELGHAALWLAAAFALLQAVWPAMGLARGDAQAIHMAVPAALTQAGLTILSFAALTWCFWVSDFSVALVSSNSHTMKPALYKISGVWANHEGSMLLWAMVLALAGAAVALFGRNLGTAFQARVLSVQALIALGFFAFLLLASNPFTRIDPAPVEGSGLNPLLQDPGLAFHPPLLYAGYVGMSVAFAFAVAAMLDRKVGPEWARMVRPWVLVAWSFLTAGIALGSYWAYYELGWGGWWFWDPVENASLMPWLAATALLHSISVLATRDALRNWTMLLAVAAFSFSMIGTFIVRSGLLTSVHAFAVDPTRGAFLLVLLALYIGGALTLYALRAHTVEVGRGFAAFSREGGLVVNNLLLSAMLGVIFLGTLYPLILEAATGEKISVGAPYFDATVLPILLPMAALMAVGPFLAWKRADGAKVVRRLIVPILLTAAAAVVAAVSGLSFMAVTAFGVAAGLALASVAIVMRRHAGLARWGLALAHLGVAVSIAGATANGALGAQTLANLAMGESAQVGRFTATLVNVMPTAGSNYTALEGTIRVRDGNAPVAMLEPQSRSYAFPQMETTETGIAALWDGDVYAALGKPDGQGRWQVRLQWHPFIRLIWIGSLLMAIGGLVAAFGGPRNKMGEHP